MSTAFDFSAKLLSKMTAVRDIDGVSDDIFNYAWDVIEYTEDVNPELYKALLQTNEFYGRGKTGYVVCYVDLPPSVLKGDVAFRKQELFERLKKSCKAILRYVGKPHSPDSLRTFSSYGLKVKEMSNSDGTEYVVLTTVKGAYCQLTTDLQVTLTKHNDIKYEFTITVDKIFKRRKPGIIPDYND